MKKPTLSIILLILVGIGLSNPDLGLNMDVVSWLGQFVSGEVQ